MTRCAAGDPTAPKRRRLKMSDDYGSRKKHSQVLDRRPLRYWQKFNDWWRGEFDKHNRRPTAEEIIM